MMTSNALAESDRAKSLNRTHDRANKPCQVIVRFWGCLRSIGMGMKLNGDPLVDMVDIIDKGNSAEPANSS